MEAERTAPEIETRTIRKVRRRLVPFLMLLYFIAYLDRTNIGMASTTMNADVGLTPWAYGFGLGIFFLGYCLFEVPSNMVLEKVGARRWIARIMLTWGIISGLFALTSGPWSFGILRFLLGVAEAGFFPGVIFYLSFWFPARYRAGIIGMFMAAVPISSAIGNPISGAIMEMDGLFGLHGWQWLFIVEAVPAVILSGVVLNYLTDRPEEADWLEEDEREWLVAEMKKEAEGKVSSHGLAAVFKALSDPRILSLAVIYFGTSAGLYTLSNWAPGLVRSDYGLSPLQIGIILALPPLATIFAMIYWGGHSDRMNERNWHVFIPCAAAAIGLVVAANASSLILLVAALIVVNMGIGSAKPPIWAIPPTFLTGTSAAVGIAAINSIGNLGGGGVAGSIMIGWLKETTGSHEAGFYMVAALLALSAALILLMPKYKSVTQNQRVTST